MRTFATFLLLLLAGAAHASGGISCKGKGEGVSFAFEGGVTRGMGGALFSFRGTTAVTAPSVAKDLRRVAFAREHVAQYWLDSRRLGVVLYRERTGNRPHGYVELTVEAAPAGEEGTYKGRFALSVFDATEDGSGTGRAFDAQGRVSCFVE